MHKHFNYPEPHMDRRYIVFSGTVAALTAAGMGATAAAITAGAVTAGVIGAGAYAVNKMTQTPKSSTPGMPAAVAEAAPSVSKAEQEAATQIKNKRISAARNRTIYNAGGALGLSNADKSNTILKTLTGV